MQAMEHMVGTIPQEDIATFIKLNENPHVHVPEQIREARGGESRCWYGACKPSGLGLGYLDLQSTQHHGLYPIIIYVYIYNININIHININMNTSL